MFAGLSLLAPRHWPAPCPVCRQWSRARPCGACVARFGSATPRCERCAIAVPAGAPLCGACLAAPPAFARAVAAVDYRFPWDRLITRFKFGADLALLPALSQLMQDALRSDAGRDAAKVDVVLPMPLAPQRLRERGFNQSWELARTVARGLGLPARHDLLLRWRDTGHQTGLARDDRARNLQGAFMPAPHARELLSGRCVALVDDVMTTGASAQQATQALLEGGAARVHLWLLARTPAQADA